MFQFTPLASLTLCIQVEMTASSAAGFPHSGIAGSKDACSSPTLFAAYHALPRLSVPRHPPCALVRLTGNSLVLQTHTHFPAGARSTSTSFDGSARRPPRNPPPETDSRRSRDGHAQALRPFPPLDPDFQCGKYGNSGGGGCACARETGNAVAFDL